MEKELLPNNTTLASLRRLLREGRKRTEIAKPVLITLTLWNYGASSAGAGRIVEKVTVYKGGTGEGTKEFKSIKEAREHIEGWKEEENNVDSSN